MIVYDADGQILGRLSSVVAKQLLEGEKIEIVNIEKVVISGNKKERVEHYQKRVERGDPHKGPFFPRTPVGIFKRAVRGMLPIKKPKGRDAFKNLKAHVGVPDHLKGKTPQRVEAAEASRLSTNTISIGKLSIALGSKKRWED